LISTWRLGSDARRGGSAMAGVPSPEELAHVVEILRPRVVDSAIQKVRQPSPTRFLFDLFRPGSGKTRLLVDLDPQSLRFQATGLKLPNPADAPALLLLLRRLLENGRIRNLEALPRDRVVELTVDRLVDGELMRRRLIFELIPIRPVLFVVGPDGVVEAASNSVSSDHRDVKRGSRYVSPRPAELKESGAVFARFGDWRDEDLFDLLDAELEDAGPAEGPDRGAIRRAITKALKRQSKRVAKVEQDWRRSEGGEELMRQGELLKFALGECRRGMESIRIRDWEAEDETWVEIALDSRLDPHENIEALFKRAKKKVRSQEQVLERLEEQREILRRLNEIDAAVEKSSADELGALLAELKALGIEVEIAQRSTGGRKKAAAPPPRLPYHVYRSRDGLEIRVGRGARDNDELTFKHCRGNEWWLHVQDYAGSHVVVKTEGELPEQTLLDAGTLAILASKAKNAAKVSVSYTRRKNLSKARGAPAGQVLLKSHRTVLVRVEADRIKRLENSRG
jgi:predicted ribosome quality control (RQC) complex YloA/Tae2 family protein